MSKNGRYRIITIHSQNRSAENQNNGVVCFGWAVVSAAVVPAHTACVTTRYRILYGVRPSGPSDLTRFLLRCRIVVIKKNNNNCRLRRNHSRDKLMWPKVELDWICTVIQEGIWNFWRVILCVITTMTTRNRRKKDCQPLVKRTYVPCAVVPSTMPTWWPVDGKTHC